MVYPSIHGARQSGFTLLEVAIVLLIMGALLGSVLRPFGADLVERKRKATSVLLYEVRDALIGYAAAQHRLPCPIVSGDQPHGNCSLEHGYVPSAVLGVAGQYDDNGLLLDAWGSPLRYSVSASDADNDGVPDFTSAGEMRDVGLQFLAPDFEVCDTTAPCLLLRANQVPVVLISEGAMTSKGSADELENSDFDNRFVSRDLDQAGDDQYDDIVVWLSENILYTELIKASVLP